MKRVSHTSASRDPLLHIETDGCIVNIRVGLSDSDGRRVTSVEIIPEDETRAPDLDGRHWHLDGTRNNRIIRQAAYDPLALDVASDEVGSTERHLQDVEDGGEVLSHLARHHDYTDAAAALDQDDEPNTVHARLHEVTEGKA